MTSKNKQTHRVPKNILEAFFSAIWPLNTWKKKVVLIVIVIAFGCFSIWTSLPEGKKDTLIDFIIARIINRSEPVQKPDAKSDLPPSSIAQPSFNKDNSRVLQVAPKEMREIKPFKEPLNSNKKQQMVESNFEITGATDAEKNTIRRGLNDLNVKAANINIVKSERDNSRNIYIEVTYQDNITGTYSFSTHLDNAANLIISEIVSGRLKPAT